ncbi:MAG: CRISPR-associated helicase Cas3' [Acidimicrobiales bacterium]
MRELAVLWAKTGTSGDEKRWHPLCFHVLDVAAVGAVLWRRWLARAVRREVTTWWDDDEAVAGAFVAWLCGAHDLGKASPAFQAKHPDLCARVKQAGFGFQGYVSTDAAATPHNIVSGLAVADYLERCGWPKRIRNQLGELAVAHHGRFVQGWTQYEHQAGTVGDDRWRACRVELASQLAGLVGFKADRPREAALPQSLRLALSGLVTVADWIGSTEEWFPHACRIGDDAPEIDGRTWFECSMERAEVAVDELLRPAAWSPLDGLDPELMHDVGHQKSVSPEASGRFFRARFGEAFEPRPVQRRAIEVAAQAGAPPLMLIEAPTGEGKTEAAMAAAEVLASRFGCDGLFIALPTQATGNQMFERVLTWLERQPGRHTVSLAHGKASMSKRYKALKAGPVAIDEDDSARAGLGATGGEARSEPEHPSQLQASEWIAGRKRALLAPFVVGTVDQLLLAALASRHVALRHIGLAGKVVIVDEVHAYDAYMSVFLHRALSWLAAQRIPVILLSATLPDAQRAELLDAYGATPGSSTDASPTVSEYPVIVVQEGGGDAPMRVEPVRGTVNARRVRVELVPEPPRQRGDGGKPEVGDDVILGLLERKLEAGGCALVLRNTVRRAQDSYESIRSAFPDWPVTLFHSRYIPPDRRDREMDLQQRFGPPSKASSRSRPERAVVVATQVVEQSLDVDFDVLITDLAPLDLLVQRVGRVHRHDRGRRPEAVAEPQMYVVGWDRDGGPGPRVPGGSLGIYGGHLLVRTWAVLRDLCPDGHLEVPGDLRRLLAATYGPDQHDPDDLRERLSALLDKERKALKERRHVAAQFALKAPGKPSELLAGAFVATFGAADEDDPTARACVRDGDAGAEVIVLVDGTPASSVGSRSAPSRYEVDELLNSVVTLPSYVLSDGLDDLANASDRWSVAAVRRLKLLELDAEGYGEVGDWRVRYTAEKGLEVWKDRA